MAEDIEVVIKIPKYYLTHPQDYSCLAECVRRGTPLPKGHGRLIDADELYNSLEFPTLQFVSAFKQVLDDAPTVIEAEMEGAEE